jgi:hypothetical protein
VILGVVFFFLEDLVNIQTLPFNALSPPASEGITALRVLCNA